MILVDVRRGRSDPRSRSEMTKISAVVYRPSRHMLVEWQRSQTTTSSPAKLVSGNIGGAGRSDAGVDRWGLASAPAGINHKRRLTTLETKRSLNS
jgi:hypothetical protein